MCQLSINFLIYIVSCQGVVQLRGLVPAYPWEIPLRLMLVSLFYSMEVPLKLKIKNICGKLRMERSFVKIIGFCIGCDRNGDRVSKNNESFHICISDLKVALVSYEKFGTLSIYYLVSSPSPFISNSPKIFLARSAAVS